MNGVWLQLLIIIVLTLANGVFAASEIAIVSSRRNRLQQRADAGSHSARVALELAEEPNRFLATVQVGITLISIFAGAFGGGSLAGPVADLIRPVVGASAPAVALALVVFVITYLSLILGELVPKRLALQNAEAIAALVAPSMRFLSRVAAPIVWFLTFSTQSVLRLLGRSNQQEEQVTEEDILSMVREGTQGGTVEASERELIERVFDFTDASARSIMTPRSEMFAIQIDTPIGEVVERVIEAGYSRVPVYHGSIDKIEGVLHAKDLLQAAYRNDDTVQISSLLRPPVFVLEHQSLADVLQMFRQTRVHIAFVVDEYGQIDGLVTLEDVLEELTGDIDDEYDEANTMVVRRADGSYLVDGLLPYSDAEDVLQLPPRSTIDDLPDFDTIAGLMLALLEHIPSAGEHVTWRDWYLEVVDMDGVRIDKVLMRHTTMQHDQAQSEASLAMGALLPLPQHTEHARDERTE
jgi:putative hemolysin